MSQCDICGAIDGNVWHQGHDTRFHALSDRIAALEMDSAGSASTPEHGVNVLPSHGVTPDQVPPSAFAPADEMCSSESEPMPLMGYLCTEMRGHEGPHRCVHATWDTEVAVVGAPSSHGQDEISASHLPAPRQTSATALCFAHGEYNPNFGCLMCGAKESGPSGGVDHAGTASDKTLREDTDSPGVDHGVDASGLSGAVPGQTPDALIDAAVRESGMFEIAEPNDEVPQALKDKMFEEGRDLMRRVFAIFQLGDGPGADMRLAIELAWGLIANAYGGNWDDAPQEWSLAAARWRDEHLSLLTNEELERLADSNGSDVT